MPNTTVPATAEGMPKFNRAAIMSDAWERYRYIRRQCSALQIARGIVDASFSACLKTAWRVAKQNRAKVADAAKVAPLAGTPAGERLRAFADWLSLAALQRRRPSRRHQNRLYRRSLKRDR